MLKFLIVCMLATLAYCEEPAAPAAPEAPTTPDVEAVTDPEIDAVDEAMPDEYDDYEDDEGDYDMDMAEDSFEGTPEGEGLDMPDMPDMGTTPEDAAKAPTLDVPETPAEATPEAKKK